MINHINNTDQSFLLDVFSFPRYGATRAIVIAITCTFFEFFNIPVFWPILVMYFIVLFVITMKRQIKVSKNTVTVTNSSLCKWFWNKLQEIIFLLQTDMCLSKSPICLHKTKCGHIHSRMHCVCLLKIVCVSPYL